MHAYEKYEWSQSDTYAFEGPNVDLNLDGGDPAIAAAQEAYLWLRNNTERNAYVLVRPTNMNSMTMPVIAQRRAVCASGKKDLHYRFPHQLELLKGARGLLNALERHAHPAAPLRSLLNIQLPWPDSFFVLAVNEDGRSMERLSAEATRWQSDLEVRFANAGWVIYAVRVRAGAF